MIKLVVFVQSVERNQRQQSNSADADLDFVPVDVSCIVKIEERLQSVTDRVVALTVVVLVVLVLVVIIVIVIISVKQWFVQV